MFYNVSLPIFVYEIINPNPVIVVAFSDVGGQLFEAG